MEGIIDRIKQLVDDSGLSSMEFAKKAGIQPARFSHMMTGRNKPGLDLIQGIVTAFPDTDAHWLLTGEEKPAEAREMDQGLFGQGHIRDEKGDEKELKAPNVHNPPVPRQEPEHQVLAGTSKGISRIVVLYRDGTYQAFNPENT